MKRINIELDQIEYPILIEQNITKSLHTIIAKQKLFNNYFIIIDSNVVDSYGSRFNKSLEQLEGRISIYTINAKEANKNLSEVTHIVETMLANHFGRDTTIIAIGGGVTCDIAGFVASIYMRGVSLVIVPTTLLSSIDAAIGGKNGVNFGEIKNILGSFLQPKCVIIDPILLESLPKTEIISGIGELIKYALLSNYNFFFFINNNLTDILAKDVDLLEKAISKSAKLKSAVIQKDVTEKSTRRILNLGHTFGHSFESTLKFKITHGQAVVAGIIASLFLAERIGLLPTNKKDLFLKLLLKLNLPKALKKIDSKEVIQKMYGDKKTSSGNITFVLLADIGQTVIDYIAKEEDIFYSIDEMKKLI